MKVPEIACTPSRPCIGCRRALDTAHEYVSPPPDPLALCQQALPAMGTE